jgi:NAD(P)-dependent dehydrogenase (short-subunit alcohol dehydrogenase family)/acyl dehydratase/putative sterol carrier protein
MGLFDGKVVVITGAGGGIGRAHALAFAREGAAVVVNDLGSTREGTGASARMADAVVEEIEKAGGRAVANYNSVADFEAARGIVKAALEAFGRIDILVNNAGILRDKSLLKMEEAMFDMVLAVHLKGTWNCTKHAAEAMVAWGKGGRIINTTSIAGLKGNFGQSNYGAAKAGIWGLTLTAAIELKKHGITVNAIAPMAKTRLTEDIDLVPEEMKPEHISPVVLWLASDMAEGVTGRCFGVHPPRIFEYKMEMTEGAEKPGGVWTPAEIQAALPKIERLGAAPAAAPAPAPAARELASIVDRLVKAAPRFFVKERAGGMKSNFHLVIEGAKDYTIRIENQECTVLEGLEGTPTCRIKTDAETYVGMAEGKVNPQKAFMEQKLTADNLGEAMKYATAFRQPKPEEIRALIGAGESAAPFAPQAAAAAAPTRSPKEIVGEIFRRMGESFCPEKAAGWKAAILWKVGGAGDYTVEVEGGKVSTREGAPEKPSCTVKLSAETLIGMVSGKVNPQKAFMEGKIAADNLSDMIKFGAAFDLKKGAAAAEAAAAPPAPSSAAVRGGGLNRAYLGRSFSGGAHFVRPEMLKAYALATNDPNPHYLGEKEPFVAPPIFPVRLFKDCMFKPLTDPGLGADLLRLVHGEQDMRFYRPLRPWDLVTTRAIVHSIEDKSSGQILRLLEKGFVEGDLVVEALTTLFIRGEKKAEKKEESPAAPPQKGEVLFQQIMEVTKDQPWRYAEASGDNNPIHVDEAVAKMAGFPSVILQGLCTMAFSSRAIVIEACGGDPRRLRRLAVRFSKPVFPGDRIATSAWKVAEEEGLIRYGFEATNQAGVPVITNGIAEVAIA